jgi:hypothetical protein
MSDALLAAWQKGLAKLASEGVELPPPGHTALETARIEFETLAGPIQSQAGFAKEAPKLAAHMVTEALARHYYELASKDWM